MCKFLLNFIAISSRYDQPKSGLGGWQFRCFSQCRIYWSSSPNILYLCVATCDSGHNCKLAVHWACYRGTAVTSNFGLNCYRWVTIFTSFPRSEILLKLQFHGVLLVFYVIKAPWLRMVYQNIDHVGFDQISRWYCCMVFLNVFWKSILLTPSPQ